MAIIKKYSDDKKICHVTFFIPKEISDKFEQVNLVGDFNDWDFHNDKFTRNDSDGLFSIECNLDAGKEYQFRYLGNGEIWFNEPEANRQVLTHFGDSENSVLEI